MANKTSSNVASKSSREQRVCDKAQAICLFLTCI